MAFSAISRETLLNIFILVNKLEAITGSMTFNSKFPDWPATVIVASLPMT